MDGDTIGIVAHGHATIIGRDDEGVEEIEPVWRDIYGWSPFEWGRGRRLHARRAHLDVDLRVPSGELPRVGEQRERSLVTPDL
jgi:hypothetical protein